MALVSRQLNLMCKYGIRRRDCFPLRMKLFETSKNKSHVCTYFIISSNHQYSTLQPGKKFHTTHLLNHSLAVSNISTHYHLSTDSGLDKIQGLQTVTESAPNLVSFVTTGAADGITTKAAAGSISAEPANSFTELPAVDHAETILSSGGDLSENLALTSADALSAISNVEIPLSEVGLGGWTPVGIVQQFIELIHVQLGIPWWSSIILATFIARVFLFPVLVKAQQNAAKLSNHMPQLQVLQEKFGQARRTGNVIEASRYAMEIQLFMKQKNINPLKSALIPLCQAPVFISFFLGLRSMAKLPLESFKTGGISWITDLTIPDPYYITPLITCGTLYIVIKVGAESGVKLENMKIAGYVLTALPIIVFPFTVNFPAAVLCYWCASNFLTLGAVSLLKIERVRSALNIPKRKPIDPQSIRKKKGFIKSIKDSVDDQKVINAMADRSRLDDVRFKKAGIGPIPRTYSYDPTKPRPANAAAARSAQAKEYKH